MIDEPCKGMKLKACYYHWHNPQLPCDSPENIVAAQAAMKHNGLYKKGKIDGVWGELSQRAYERTLRRGLSSPFGDCVDEIPVWKPPPPRPPPSPEPERVGTEEGSTSAAPVIAAGVVGVALGALLSYWGKK